MTQSEIGNILKTLSRLDGSDVNINCALALMADFSKDEPVPDLTGDLDAINKFMGRYIGNIKQLKSEVIHREGEGMYCYGYMTTHAHETIHAEGVSEAAVRCALFVKMMHHRHPVVIKGEGFQPKGGGFAAITINGIKFTPRQVALACGVLTE